MRRRQQRFYRDLLPAPRLIFDVGANVGDFTRVFRLLGARVIALEPQTACVKVLRDRFRDDANVMIIPAALGCASGTATLWVSSQAHTISTLSDQWRRGRFAATHVWDQTQTVPVITLDSLISEYGLPDFVKIDVEGFEYQVLTGLTQPVPGLAFEWVQEDLTSCGNCLQRLIDLGPYTFSWTEGTAWQLRHPWTDPDTLLKRLGQAKVGLVGDVYARLARAHSARTPPGDAPSNIL
jgi:FkbM family methyltransferase